MVRLVPREVAHRTEWLLDDPRAAGDPHADAGRRDQTHDEPRHEKLPSLHELVASRHSGKPSRW
jgi:hypothetical protein